MLLSLLLLGFPQNRAVSKKEEYRSKRLTQPHIEDIIPIINGYERGRLTSFEEWIEQLYFEAVQKEYEKRTEIREWKTIEKSFNIISNLSGYPISFKKIEMGDSSSPSTIWVDTPGSPNGIPINVLSQGFKVLMGWLGYFIQRLVESYPIQSLDMVTTSHAILIIDEIDTYIHPKWQAKIFNVLRKEFPNTQFILSTHSPIAISSCSDGEVLLLEFVDNDIIYREINNTKGWLVENIMSEIMGISNSRDHEVVKVIDEIEILLVKKYETELNKDECKRLEKLINSINNLPQGDPIVTLLQIKSLA